MTICFQRGIMRGRNVQSGKIVFARLNCEWRKEQHNELASEISQETRRNQRWAREFGAVSIARRSWED